MPELLIEVGCEELPASFVRKAYGDLQSELVKRLGEAGLLGEGDSIALGTPRRLIVSLPNVLAIQPDRSVEQRGPAISAAYDSEGKPTKALEGFCRSQGVAPADLRKDDKYVWLTKEIKGRPATEILSELIPEAIRMLTFDKSMRWGGSRMRFARPIRWILASYDGTFVSFDIEGVQSGLESRGHRFYAPDSFSAQTLSDLLTGLRKRLVEPDPDARRSTIEEAARKVAEGSPDMPDELLEENVFLTEWPSALQGTFKEEFLELPESVLVIAMAKHEKFFPIRDAGGKLTNRFVSIRNAGEDASVRKGNEWVLNARFNDAKFFFDEDKKRRLDDFLELTSGILFQEKLGTVRQRADRLSLLCAFVAEQTGADAPEIEAARVAGLYCKADLSSGLVSELASLQGVIGGEYAKREGMPPDVCHAIASQYSPLKNLRPATPRDRTVSRLVMSEALDKVAGYLGLGIAPTGSSDPYGLRRSATTLIEAAWNWPAEMPSFDSLLGVAVEGYAAQGVNLDGAAATALLAELFASRYDAMLSEVRHDHLEAALLEDEVVAPLNPQAVRFRVKCVELLAADSAFVQAATRPANIVSAARSKGVVVSSDLIDASSLHSPEGDLLLKAVIERQATVQTAFVQGNEQAVADHLRQLVGPINAFFDSTMVMVDDEIVRDARLGLLDATDQLIRKAGDFTKIVIE